MHVKNPLKHLLIGLPGYHWEILSKIDYMYTIITFITQMCLDIYYVHSYYTYTYYIRKCITYMQTSAYIIIVIISTHSLIASIRYPNSKHQSMTLRNCERWICSKSLHSIVLYCTVSIHLYSASWS